jgi:hypothetical protein
LWSQLAKNETEDEEIEEELKKYELEALKQIEPPQKMTGM